jgi:hypothetical protein
MKDDCRTDHDYGEAIIATAMRRTALVSVCLRAACHAGRRARRPGELTPEGDQIVREAFGDPNPARWNLCPRSEQHA